MTWGGPQTDWVAYKFCCAKWFLQLHPFKRVLAWWPAHPAHNMTVYLSCNVCNHLVFHYKHFCRKARQGESAYRTGITHSSAHRLKERPLIFKRRRNLQRGLQTD